MTMTIVLFIIGLILIIKGGDWFVESAINVARISGLPEVFIGATIVSIATTIPEVTVSITSALEGYTTVAIGNALGSMICNIALILGTYLLFMPGDINDKIFQKKAMFLLIYSGVLYVFALNGIISQIDGFILTALTVYYLYCNVKDIFKGKNLKRKTSEERIYAMEKVKIIAFFIIGIVAIVAGSNLLIDNGVKIASALGVPEAIIGLTLIALGTSLPEFVTVVTSIVKKRPGIGLGNVIGANILNATLVVGVSSLIKELDIIPRNISFDFPIVMVLTLLLVVPALIKGKTYRWQGIGFLVIYTFYIVRTWGSVL